MILDACRRPESKQPDRDWALTGPLGAGQAVVGAAMGREALGCFLLLLAERACFFFFFPFVARSNSTPSS